jgi:hypothetical protein
MSIDPAKEYQSRLSEWSRRAEAFERSHARLGNVRALFFLGVLAAAAVLCRTQVSWGIALTVLVLGLALTGIWHVRIEAARNAARRGIRFYQSGLERLDGTWFGKGTTGTEFLDPHHPYAADLDVFGAGSLFELMNAAHTQIGRTTLAAWLLEAASPEEIVARQEAIKELSPKVDLRERLGFLAAETQTWIPTESLISWACQPLLLKSNAVRVLAFCLPWISLALLLTGHWPWCLGVLSIQSALRRSYKRQVESVTRTVGLVQHDLKCLADIFECLEAGKFKTERLRRLVSESGGVPASEAIQRLATFYSWISSRENPLVAVLRGWFLLETQIAFAVETWRAQFGMNVEPWLRGLGEIEALSSLAGYTYEHPADPFPEFLPAAAPAQIHAESLKHPLIPETKCVGNDVSLGPDCALMVVSGSNMSGKSTYLRTIGINLALALAGAPVRARKFRMTPVRIGASIRTLDSIHEGTSRFYAEITRLGQIVKLTGQGTPLVFLLDEILAGTNSHDRRIGAGYLARALVQRGALGLMTTHDLALAKIAEGLQPPGANYHFEDQMLNGKMNFDYRLRPGVVEKSNALELMRSVGLDVTDQTGR